MKSFILFITITIITASNIIGQNIRLEGTYKGKNLFVMNPSTENHSFCVDSILINKMHSKDELNSNTIEIDFALLNIKPQTPVEVLIYHKTNCTPQVMNPDAIKKQFSFTIENPKVNKNGTLSWKINGKADTDSFSVEQFKWKKWILVEKVPYNETVSEYSTHIKTHSGYNMFRVSKSNGKVCSPNAKYTSTAKPISILDLKPTNSITFSDQTLYELYDNKGILIEKGESKEILIKGLPKGEYWVNYDNKTDKILKK
ncbi:MAG: hypothetical protein WCH34_16470 [Bacteroidota bacterium]